LRRILHVDVDAMFVQCAVMADPERLAGERLILVGGSPTGRGVVTSASYGCRAFGVRSAMPTATALRLCPAALVVRVPGEMIRKKSRELALALQEWSPLAAMASVDEAYLDLTGTEALYHQENLHVTAMRLQKVIKRNVGLDVSIGGATNRQVAKLATSFAKPAGVFVVPPGEESNFVAGLKIEDLIGIGPAFMESLRRRGITTMDSLRALDVETMTGWWGADRARWLWRKCRGIDDTPVMVDHVTRSVSSETTFSRDIDDIAGLERALLAQVADAAASLRGQELFARTITVKLRDTEFRDRSRSRTLAQPVQTDRAIFSVARGLLGDLRRHRATPSRLIGVALTNLTRDPEPLQRALIGLTPPIEDERDRSLSQVVDRIRRKHGRVIGLGTVVEREKGKGEG
jgi:DNA polymerase IV